jgi:outer membrane protein assembly factor BamB
MTRLRIYSGGTGSLQYDSGGSADDAQSDQVRREFNAGVLLYYLPTQNQVHGYVKLHRGVEEQFLAVYEDGSDGLVDGLKSAVERAADERDWRIVSANQINQAVFEALGTDRTTEPNVGLDQIRGDIEQGRTVDFTAGSGRSAVELFEYLRGEFPERTIAITTGGRAGPTEGADIVIEADPSYTHSQPTVAGEAAKRLHERQIAADTEALREQLEQLGEATGASSRAELGRRMATALDSAGVTDRFGIAVRDERAPPAKRELFRRYALLSFGLVALAGLLVVARLTASELSGLLTRSLELGLPVVGVGPSITVPSWQLLVLSGVGILVGVLSSTLVRNTLGLRVSSLVAAVDGVLSSGSRGHGGDRRRTTAVSDALAQLQSRTTSNERFVQEVKEILHDYGVAVTTRETATQDRRRGRIFGLAVGVALGAATTAATYVALDRLLSVLGDNWGLLVQGLLLLTVAVLLVRGGVGIVRFVSGSRRTAPRSKNRSRSPPSSSTGTPRPSQQRATRGRGETRPAEQQGSDTPAHTGDGRPEPPETSGSTPPSPSDDTTPTETVSLDEDKNEGGAETATSGPDGEPANQSANPAEEVLPEDTVDSTVDIEHDRASEDAHGGEAGTDGKDGDGRGPTAPPSGGDTIEPDVEPPGDRSSALGRGGHGTPTGDEFPMYRYDPANTGHATNVSDTAVPVEPRVRWIQRFDEAIYSSSAVVGEQVYVGCRDGNVYALDTAAGEPTAKYTTDSKFDASPAVVDDTVFIGNWAGNLYALHASDLTPVWGEAPGDRFIASPTVVDGRVYVATTDGDVGAMGVDSGEQLWERSLGAPVTATPAVAGNHVYVGTGSSDGSSGAVVALTADGEKRWAQPLDGGVAASSPAVVDDMVYVGCQDERVYALDAETGDIEWRFETEGSVDASPAVADGTVFVGSTDERFYALDRLEGTTRWTAPIGESIGAPATVAGTHVYVGDGGGHLHALDTATGDRVWSYAATDGTIMTNPAIADGTLYVGTSAGELCALEPEP